MKTIALTLFTLFITLTLSAQGCMSSEYLTKGTHWEVANFDKKGKNTGLVKYDILNVSHNGEQSFWEIKTQVFDEKEESINEGTFELVCENGIYKMDMSQMLPAETMQSLQSMEVEMDGSTINYPTEKDVNTILDDAYITLTAATSGMVVMNMKLTITDRKIEGIETITTEAGTFECLKITERTKLENKMFNREYSSITWFLPGFGVVKSESYDKKDKLMGSSQLTALTR
jgi:hypothetical protein